MQNKFDYSSYIIQEKFEYAKHKMHPLFTFMQITFILGNKVDVKQARTNAVCLRGVKYYIIKSLRITKHKSIHNLLIEG